MREHIKESDFLAKTKSVTDWIEEYATTYRSTKLKDLAKQYKSLDLEKKLNHFFITDILGGTNTIFDDDHLKETRTEDILREKLFNDALLEGKPILENIRLIISNPDFATIV